LRRTIATQLTILVLEVDKAVVEAAPLGGVVRSGHSNVPSLQKKKKQQEGGVISALLVNAEASEGLIFGSSQRA
jgi:hypothetical protein